MTETKPALPMRCYVCDGTEWHRIVANGRPIHSESTIQTCKTCGNLCHEVDVSKEEEVKAYYRKEYRPKPSIMNLITTTHKLNYIRVFLKDWLKERQGKPMVVGDVGAATGYVLNWFRQMGHKVAGSELTLTYRRTAEHYYGIPLAEELEPKHRYDLIVVYHVLEHLYDPDRKLAHYASLLAEGGRIFLATPEWLAALEEASGTPTQSFDHLFHKNHINLFTSVSLQNVFRKAGLRIVKEDHVQYGQTYLLEKAGKPAPAGLDGDGREVPAEQWLTKEDWREVDRLTRLHAEAIALHAQGKDREAIALVPNFPEAWLAQVFGRSAKDLAKQVDLLGDAERHVGGNFRFILARGQWNYQQGRLAEAIKDYQRVLDLKPNEDTYMFMAYALAQSGRLDEASNCFSIACGMDPRKWAEAQGWLLSIASERPTWDERLLTEARQRLSLPPGLQPTQPGRPEPQGAA